jgi:hypothetical protein
LPPRKNTSQQQLYTVLAFLFLALTLGFAGWKIRAYLANRQESKVKETVKEIVKEVPGPDTESPETKRRRLLEEQRKEAEHKAELKRMMDQADVAERARLMAIERERVAKEEADKIAAENSRLQKQKADADEQAKIRAAEAEQKAAEQEAARKKAAADALEAQRSADEALRRERAAAEQIARERAINAEKERMRVPVYNGPNRGTIVWTGTVKPGLEVQIDGDTCNTGQLNGVLPGVMIQVDTPPELRSKVQIVNTPNATNGYKLLSFRVVRGSGPLTVTLNWNRP